jgi:hypothetical protein
MFTARLCASCPTHRILGTGIRSPPVEFTHRLRLIAFEIGTIEELEDAGRRMKEAGALMDRIEQPMHLSVYGRDPDGIPLEIVWRTPNGRTSGACQWITCAPHSDSATERYEDDLNADSDDRPVMAGMRPWVCSLIG